METTRQEPVTLLVDYRGFLRRQWLPMVLIMLVGVGVALSLLSALPKSYASQATVLVQQTNDPTVSATLGSQGTLNMDTEAQVVTSEAVARRAKRIGSLAGPESRLASGLSVSVPANTSILSLTYTASDPAEAVRGAQAFATSYLRFRSSQQTNQLTSQIDRLTSQATRTGDQARAINKRLPGLKGAAASDAQQELARLQLRAKTIDRKLLPLQTASTSAGSMLSSARTPTSATSPNPTLVVGSVLGLFFLAGLSLLFWRDRRKGRIRRSVELSGLPIKVLGEVNRVRRRRGARDFAISDLVGHAALQDYRRIAFAIQARVPSANEAVLLTGVARDQLADEVAEVLGLVVARMGTQVTLIQARDDDSEAYFAAESSPVDGPGSASLLHEGSVQSHQVSQWLSDRGPHQGLALFSTEPLGVSADAQSVSPYARLTVLVIELNRTTQAQVTEALRQLHQVGTDNLAGIVVRKARRRRSRSRARAGTGRGGSRTERRVVNDGAHDEVPASSAGHVST